MTFNTPQIIYLVLFFVGLGVELEKHGSPKTGTHNAWVSIIAGATILGLLYWGGFFG